MNTASEIVDRIRTQFNIPEHLAIVLWDALDEGLKLRNDPPDVHDELLKAFIIIKETINE